MPAPLHWVSSGNKAGPALLLLHPLGASHVFWDECKAIWNERFHVIAVDLRNAGQSPRMQGLWRGSDHAADLKDLRLSLGLDRFILVGCAIGSLIATLYAALEPQHVSGLILADTTPYLDEVSRVRTEARVQAVLKHGMETLLPEVIDLAFKNLPQDERYKRYFDIFRGNDPAAYGAFARGMMGTDIREAATCLTCPTLVTAGIHDILLPPDHSRQVHQRIKDSEFVLLENAAHFPPFQAPEAFAALVTDFINRRVLPLS